jgi:hypothetical protein
MRVDYWLRGYFLFLGNLNRYVTGWSTHHGEAERGSSSLPLKPKGVMKNYNFRTEYEPLGLV